MVIGKFLSGPKEHPASHHLNDDVCSAAGLVANHCAKSLIADVATRPMIGIRHYLYPIMDRMRGW